MPQKITAHADLRLRRDSLVFHLRLPLAHHHTQGQLGERGGPVGGRAHVHLLPDPRADRLLRRQGLDQQVPLLQEGRPVGGGGQAGADRARQLPAR